MANLVSAGYSNQSLGNALYKTEDRIIEFKGISRRSMKDDGEMVDALNVTADAYPSLRPRRPRGEYPIDADIFRPIRIIAKFERLAMIAVDDDNHVNFYYDHQKIVAVNDLTPDSFMVAIHTKICFFPQKTYLEIFPEGQGGYRIGNYLSMEASAENLSDLTVTISNEDARVTLASNPGFKYDDAVNLIGTLSYRPSGSSTAQTMDCNASCMVKEIVNNNTLVLPRETFIEMTGQGATEIKFSGDITRTIPANLDYVIEWNNRLWGASNDDNTVYACKLGDPTNWMYYQSTGLDSYAATQGTDGVWTGAAVYSSHIIFFKEFSMCRVYGTAPSNYQVTNTNVYGVEKGSALSVVTVNDTVFYKSTIGIMAYSGGTPVCISDALGVSFANVVAGTENTKYYASCQMADGGYELYVYDIGKSLWYREDPTKFRACANVGDRMYYITSEGSQLMCGDDVFCDPLLMCSASDTSARICVINPQNRAESMEEIEWMAEFGPFHEFIESKKIYSRILLRAKAWGESSMKVYIALDEGDWMLVRSYEHVRTKGEMIPILPRRCDRYSIKLEGKGDCEILSLTRKVRQGTTGDL